MNPQTVLVLEDDALIAELLTIDLEAMGLRVLGPAYNCSSALELLLRDRPDFAILDTQLGPETCESVLDQCTVLGIPIVIASGHAASELPLFAVGLPLLRKPYLADDITALVARIQPTNTQPR